ncbi:hypothetical protein LUZ63_006482 [Rhynchospora breviuscula]|uniref:Cyclic nucleotide-binding domain-containing protein n=1 Tax=Rhynchospora breviuscula TaxID=2022672 RepID=A0A9Q0CQG0_9POAL|nr:hypothetical protein LUZ63_006482 [Rhynchospora breviuscula]
MSPERGKHKKLQKSVNRMLLSLSKPVTNNPSQVPSSPKDPTNCPKLILDPDGYILLTWNRAFLMSCFMALCIDPLFFFLPFVDNTYPYLCIRTDQHLACVLTILRCMVDMVYLINIIIKFHTAYVDPISEVLGKGELITNPRLIVNRYLRKGFLIDLLGALPFPQVMVWFILPQISFIHINTPYLLFILFQYTIRVYLIIPLSNKIIKVMGFLARTAWAGAIYNLLLYLMASHVVGAVFYLLAMDRQATCWQSQCLADATAQNNQTCNFQYLECRSTGSQDSQNWANNTSVFANCNAATKGISFNFGIFLIALQYGLTTTSLSEKYFYSLWWGFQELSTYGNPVVTSSFIGENLFAIGFTLLSIFLFAQLIGSMNIYMRSISINIEAWRMRQRDTEEWMRHQGLPEDLQQRVSRYLQYKWISTQGVDEESILKDFPVDLRRAIQHHLCLYLVRRVPFFSEMDHQLLDAICECMVPFLRTENTYIIREDETVREMLLIIRGMAESSPSNGGNNDFYNSIILKPGDFCGEELFTWALLPGSEIIYPSSTRTIRTLTEVEAFTLRAEDLKIVSTRYRRLHSKKLQHKFRFYSHSWRTWAARCIQTAWRRCVSKRACATEGSRWETFFSLVNQHVIGNEVIGNQERGERQPISKIASIFRRSQHERPEEPDFSGDL